MSVNKNTKSNTNNTIRSFIIIWLTKNKLFGYFIAVKRRKLLKSKAKVNTHKFVNCIYWALFFEITAHPVI